MRTTGWRSRFEQVGLPVGVQFEVLTQEKVAPGCRPDMMVRSLRKTGALVSQLWSEHKTASGFRHEQRQDYVRALDQQPGKGRLVTITKAPSDEPATAWTRLTWQDVGELAEGVGRSWGGADWRDSALKPDAPACERVFGPAS